MVVSVVSRGLVMVLGYVYPAYECFKAVEKHTPAEFENLVFWCKYWIIVALLSVCERFADFFISWLPLYGEAKVAIFVYLWYSRIKGTSYVYGYLLQPYITNHEKQIDSSLLDMKNRAAIIAVFIWQKAINSGQKTFFEIMRYASDVSASSQSSSRWKGKDESREK